jgi:hypothetical protein
MRQVFLRATLTEDTRGYAAKQARELFRRKPEAMAMIYTGDAPTRSGFRYAEDGPIRYYRKAKGGKWGRAAGASSVALDDAIRVYATIPGPFAREIRVHFSDGSDAPGDCVDLRDFAWIRALYGMREKELEGLATEKGAIRLPRLDAIRPHGYEFRLEDLEGLREPESAPATPATPRRRTRPAYPTDADIRSLEGNEDIESPYGR